MIRLDYRDSRPIYEQVRDGLRRLMVTGVMQPGEQLPSVRSLAMELAINPNTIQKAYAELDGRGIIYTLPGRGGFVSQNAPELLAEARRSRLGTVRELARELALAGVPEDEVLACVRSAYVESRL